MTISRLTVMAVGGLAMALVAAPLSALHSQVVAPGTNPRTPTTGPVVPAQTAQADIRADLPFINEAAGANLMEVRLGEVAQRRALSTAVKQFGQRMVTDHSRLQDQLTAMASQNGVGFSPGLSAEHQREINRLQGITALQFDRAYMTLMVQGHQKDVNLFQTQAQSAQSAQVRNWASSSLPVLQQHLDLARQLATQMGVQVATVPPTQNGPVTNPNGPVTNPNGPVTNPNSPVATPNPTATPQPAQGSSQAEVKKDKRFIDEVAADNILEARLGRLAEDRAQNTAVKQFAQREDAEHTLVQVEWSAMTTSSGLAVQTGIGKNHRKKLDQLKKLSGSKFDRAYMTMEVENHKDYIDYFEKEGRAANSSQVRNLVERTLPVLMSHFREAKRIGAQVGAKTDFTLRSERVSKK